MTDQAAGAGTAVATTTPTTGQEQLQALREAGRTQLDVRRELKDMAATLANMEWGSGTKVVKGSELSPATRYLVARYARMIRADIATQIDILNGKPYANANYWKERVSGDPAHVETIQREISPVTEASLRTRAGALRTDYAALHAAGQVQAAGEVLAAAIALEREAGYIASARQNWRAPDWAKVVYETEIRRFMNAAPMEAIREGKLSWEEAQNWITSVKACNWAGGRPKHKKRDGGEYQSDPVGEAEPEKTAATRSLRRCATMAFPAWMQEYDAEIENTQRIIEAEFKVIETKGDAALPTSGPQAVLASGEPQSTPVAAAKPLPVEGVPEVGDGPPPAHWPEDGEEPVQDARVVPPKPAAPPVDLTDFPERVDYHRKLFAMLTEFDEKLKTDPARKKWSKDNGLPASTKEWTKATYEQAFGLLLDPVVSAVEAAAKTLGQNIADLAMVVLGKSTPERLGEWKQVLEVLQRRLDAAKPAATTTGADL